MRKDEVFKNEFLKGGELHGPGGPVKDPRPVIVTIEAIEDGEAPDKKPQRIIVFEIEGDRRKIALNRDRWDSLEAIANSQDDEDFVGVTVELYPIPNVRTPQGGKTTGVGIRPAPDSKNTPKPPAKPAPKSEAPPAEDGPPGDDTPPSDPLEFVKDKATAWKVAQDDAKARNEDAATLKNKWVDAVKSVGKPEKDFGVDDWRNVAEKLIEVPF
mgnify:CR=1 FL=1